MEIFRAYDIRGIYPEEINEEVVFKIAAALVKFLNPAKTRWARPYRDKLVVAQDARQSSQTLKESVITAITASGVDVIDIGMATAPLFFFSVNKLSAGGGIIITASHNLPQYNGLKLIRERAIPIGENTGLLQIKNLARDIKIAYSPLARPNRGKIRKGKVVKEDLNEEYKNYLFKKAGLSKEPAMAKNIRFDFDADQDRLFVFENGKPIRADLLSGIMIKDFLSKRPFLGKILSRPKFVYDLRFTKAIPEYIKESGGMAIRSRVGHSFIKETMRKNKAVFGAELSGHFYFKDTFYGEAPILMKLKILKIMKESGKSIKELIEPFQKYFHSGEINIEIQNSKIKSQNDNLKFKTIREKLKEIYKDGEVDELDGITIEYPDWWFNLRPSNTEPVLRLVVEAKARYVLDQKIKEITELLKNVV